MAELPWFPMYARDWLSGEGTSMMLPEQEGAFIRLLCVAWGDGSAEPSLPTDDKALAQITRLGARWKRLGGLVRAQFIERDERLYNPKLSGVWSEQRERSQRLAENGRKGGRAKAGLEPGLSPVDSGFKHTEAEAEAELQSITLSADAEAGIAELLPTDADRIALTAIVMRARSRTACLMTLRSMLTGNDPATPIVPREQFGQALRDFAGNGEQWNAAHFRGYLTRAMPRPTSSRVISSKPATDRGVLMFGKIRELIEESQQPGQPVRRVISKAKVGLLGADVMRAYETVGGADAFLNTAADKMTFLLKDFSRALEAQTHDAA